MRVTKIHASNAFSFGIAKASLTIDNLSSGLTLLVGPNGGGKTNVIRVVETIGRYLDDDLRGSQSLTPPAPNVLTPHEGSVLEIDVQFEENSEQAAIIHAAWVQTISQRSDNGMPRQIPYTNADGKSQTMQPSEAILEKYDQNMAHQVEEAMDFAPFLIGSVRLTVDRMDPFSPRVEYIFRVDGRQHILVLRGGNPGDGVIWEGGQYSKFKNASDTDGLIDETTKADLIKFLAGEAETFPALNLPTFGRFLDGASQGSAIGTEWKPNQGKAVSKWRAEFKRRLGWADERSADGRPVDIARVVRQLISRGIVCVRNWDFESKSDLTGNALGPGDLLAKLDLPAYLLIHKNGDAAMRAQFEETQTWFRKMCGASLDVRLEPHINEGITSYQPSSAADQSLSGSAVLTPGEIRHHAAIVSDRDIPLDLSGSGRDRLAILAAILTHSKADQIVLLDEPETHVHPALQSRISETMARTRRQFVVTTHSPSLVNGVGLDQVIRLTKDRREKTTASQVSERVLGSDMWTNLAPDKRWHNPDDLMFIFARLVVWVEGPRDAAVMPVWFDQICGAGSTDRLGVRFQPAGGYKGILPRAKLAQAFGIKWVSLFDADVLSDKGADRKDRAEVAGAWVEMGQKFSGIHFAVGDLDLLKPIPRKSKRRVYFCGTAPDPAKDGEGMPTAASSLETLSIFRECMPQLDESIRGSPQAYRRIATEHPIDARLRTEFPQLETMCETIKILAK